MTDLLEKLNRIVFHWEYFLPAICLLCLPVTLTTGRWGVSISDRQYFHNGIGGLFRAWQNWIDLLRAGAGTYALLHLSMTATTKADGVPFIVFLIKVAVLAVAVMMQTIRFGDGLNFFAPIFFLSGLTLMLPGYTEGGFAFVFGWAFAIGGKNARYQLPVMGVALAIIAPLLGNLSQLFMLNLALIFAPFLASTLFRKRMLLMSRGVKIPAEEAIVKQPQPETKEQPAATAKSLLKPRPSTSN